jgi:hypothetical protein
MAESGELVGDACESLKGAGRVSMGRLIKRRRSRQECMMQEAAVFQIRLCG